MRDASRGDGRARLLLTLTRDLLRLEVDPLLGGLSIQLGTLILAALARRLGDLDRGAVGADPAIVAQRLDLPRHLHACLAARDLEAVLVDALADVKLGHRGVERGQLI